MEGARDEYAEKGRLRRASTVSIGDTRLSKKGLREKRKTAMKGKEGPLNLSNSTRSAGGQLL